MLSNTDTIAQTTLIADVPYTTVGGMPLLLDILRPEPLPAAPMPVVVEIHGGGWREGSKDAERNRIFAQHGFFTVSINYRLSGEATFPAQIEDTKAAIRWLRANADTYNIDSERIGVWGHSAGAHLAALLGTSGDTHEDDAAHANEPSTRVHAVLAVSTPVYITEDVWHDEQDLIDVMRQLFGGPTPEHMDLVRMANPMTYLRNDCPPFLLIHGDRDETVPVDQSDMLYAALKGAGANVTYLRIGGGDHGLDEHWPVIMQHALAFFRKHLTNQTQGSTDER